MIKLEDQDFVINPNTGNKIDMKKLLTEQRLAMIYIDTNFPFFSSLLRNLKWIYTFQVPTQATDGTRLLVNPEFTSKLSIKMKAFVMMHEVMHCALDHMARGKNHDHHKSNVAADYEVNGLLEADGVVSKNDLKPYLFDEQYQGMSYEHIYSLSPKDPGKQDIQQGGQQGSGQSQDGGGQQGQQGGGQSQEQGPSDSDIDKMSGEQAAQSAQESANRAKEQSANAQHNGSKKDAEKARDAAERAQRAADQAKDAANNGDDETAREKAKEARDAANEAQSAANGGQQGQDGKGGQQGNSQAGAKHRQEAADAGTPAGGFISQEAGAAIAESEGYTNEDCKVESASKITQDWKDTVIEACSKSNGPGAGNMVSRFKDYYMTSHDWKSDLKKYMGKALSNVEFDTKLGKKKWLAQDVIKKYDKPAESSIDSVVFMIDVSGSVSDKLLQNIISECYTICKRKKIEKVTYCYYDDGIRQMETNDTIKADGILDPNMVTKIKKGNTKPMKEIHGRGGNSEDVAMKELEAMLKKSHKKPELVMWFTDGYTHARPAKPRNIKHMIWVIYDNLNFEVTDGSRVIHIKSEDLGK